MFARERSGFDSVPPKRKPMENRRRSATHLKSDRHADAETKRLGDREEARAEIITVASF